jgi:hypothetical protein
MGEYSRTYSGADKMKITRSFTLDLDIVKDLKKEKNQSRTIEKALRVFWSKEVDLEVIPSDHMLYELWVRAETDFDKKVLMRMWRRSKESLPSSTNQHTVSNEKSLPSESSRLSEVVSDTNCNV